MDPVFYSRDRGYRSQRAISPRCEHPVPGGCGHNPGRDNVLRLPKLMRNRPGEEGVGPAQGSHLPADVDGKYRRVGVTGSPRVPGLQLTHLVFDNTHGSELNLVLQGSPGKTTFLHPEHRRRRTGGGATQS